MKIGVVIDANVIISSAISLHGNPAKIFEALLSGEIVNFTNDEILMEIFGVLERSRNKHKDSAF